MKLKFEVNDRFEDRTDYYKYKIFDIIVDIKKDTSENFQWFIDPYLKGGLSGNKLKEIMTQELEQIKENVSYIHSISTTYKPQTHVLILKIKLHIKKEVAMNFILGQIESNIIKDVRNLLKTYKINKKGE